MRPPRNLIFWGAGATAELGIRTTAQQAKTLRTLVGARGDAQPLSERIASALGRCCAAPWPQALCDLITILGDGEESHGSIHNVDADQLQAMRRNWQPGASEDALTRRIIGLRLLYDWPALKSVFRICPGSDTDRFKLNDLFNVLDMHIPNGFGFRAPAGLERESDSAQAGPQFFNARRLIGAKNALLLILMALFYIDYQMCLSTKRNVLEQYYSFAIELARCGQRQAIETAAHTRLDSPEFYQGDVGFVSLNYDPIGLWMQFIAHRLLNKAGTVPHIGSPAVPLHLYHDFGVLIPARGVEGREADWPWYPLDEAAAQRLNEQEYPSGYRVRLTKFLFPHGCLSWRECPDCGKLSAFHGDRWDLFSASLFPPPPLLAFDRAPCNDRTPRNERRERDRGRVDARGCLHCGTLTYAHHTQTVMQSSLKSPPPSFIDDIQRDLRAAAMQADHFIFIGYSLPPDDVTYRAFFSARRRREKGPEATFPRCSIVGRDTDHPGWYGPELLDGWKLPPDGVIQAARDIFGRENVRFFGGGAPRVFLDEAGRATEDKLKQLLEWR